MAKPINIDHVYLKNWKSSHFGESGKSIIDKGVKKNFGLSFFISNILYIEPRVLL